MKTLLIGSAPTLERLRARISEYFYSECTIKGTEVHNANGHLKAYRVIEKRGRFRFELIDQGDTK